jgi:hypothetical protein
MPSLVDALARLSVAETEAELWPPFLDAFPIGNVALSTLGDPLGSQTIAASSPVALRVEEIQLDLGEGPGWEALRIGAPVLVPDLETASAPRWPMALNSIRATSVSGLFAFPMCVGPLALGCVDFTVRSMVTLTAADVTGVGTLADAAARRVLRRALSVSENGGLEAPFGRYSRREIHQATGMIAAQLGLSVADASLILHAHAYAAGRSLQDVAQQVVAKTLDLGQMGIDSKEDRHDTDS